MIALEWKHPYRGNIVETVCALHEREVMGALRVLAIGCGGRVARPSEGGCTRCENDGARPRTFIDDLAGKPGLLSAP